MAFETIEQANEFELKANKEITELKQQLENQKTVLREKEETEQKLSKEIERLKIKNYEFFEQISNQTNNSENHSGSNNRQEDSEPSIDDILKNID